MKRDHVYIVVITLAFLISLWFAKPLREFLSASGWEETKAKLVAGSIVRFFILGALVWAIRKLRFESFNGIGKGAGVRNLHALIIPLGFILMGLMSNFQTYLDADKYLLLLFVLSVFLVGFVEEFAFRGLVLPLFIKSFSGRKSVLYWSAVLSALMFGSVHFINLFREPGNLVGITSQVFFALSIGVFFAGLLLRTGNIILPALLHGLVNFSFGAGDLKPEMQEAVGKASDEVINWSSFIPTILFFSIILTGGLYMIWKTDREDVLRKLEPNLQY